MNSLLARTIAGLLGVLLTASLAFGQHHRPRPNHPGPRPRHRPPARMPTAPPTVRHKPPFQPPVVGRHRPPKLFPGRPGFRPRPVVLVPRGVPESTEGIIEGDVAVGETASVTTEGVSADDGYQTVRYLVVNNQTGQQLRVYVQRPEEDQPKCWTFEPGEKDVLLVDGQRLAASQVWIWAESKTGSWTKYKEEALVMVPEPYQADEIGTWTHIFQ
jgi:hypothetical protein